MSRLFAVLFLLSLAAAPSWGQGVVDVEVNGSTVTAKIELPPALEADLTISFEQVVGLSAGASSLGLSATTVNPNAPALVGRLPDVSLTGIPAGFPVLLEIEPPAAGPLSFSGVVTLGLHTHNLSYTVDCPLRLFAADDGGPFYDITNTMGMGSYRVGASKGGFSEFLIVTDLRPIAAVVNSKFDHVQEILDYYASEIDDSVHTTLQGHLDAAWSWYTAGDILSANNEIEDFIDVVEAHSGSGIPATWRSARDLVNVAGLLRERASTLRFSLTLSAS